MKNFIRENPTIAFGLGLPLILVAVFLLASGLPSLFVDPPKYEVLYMTNFYNANAGLQVSVVSRRVQVVYQGSMQGYQKPRLWRYNPATGGVTEIFLMLPPGLAPAGQKITPEDAAKITPIEVPDVANLTVDPSSIAPDGYEFITGERVYGGDVFTGLFYSGRYRNEAVLTKKGRSIRLPRVSGEYYGNGVRLVGWVVAP